MLPIPTPFPGNANNLVLEIMKDYAKTLCGEDQGVVLEFVNPNYKDETWTENEIGMNACARYSKTLSKRIS